MVTATVMATASDGATFQMSVDQAAGKVLDFLMEDPACACIMRAFADDRVKTFAPPADEELDGSLYETMWYSATTDFHSKVLARAIVMLSTDPFKPTQVEKDPTDD